MGFRDFFRPAWQHSVVSKRERAVRNLEDPALAAMIFRTDASPAVKHAALERLIALDRRQGEALFSVLLRYDLDASAVTYLNAAKHLSDLVGYLGEITWRAAIIEKLRQSDPSVWPKTLISIVGGHEQSDDPVLKAFAQETLRTHELPLARQAVLVALLSGLSVKAVRETDQLTVSAWAEWREGRKVFYVRNRKSDGWGSGLITCRSAEDAAAEFVIAVGPKAAVEAAARAATPGENIQAAGVSKD
jgi:hypothetical protein